MRYSYEYKLKCVEMYKQGSWPEKPEDIMDEQYFHKLIRTWYRLEQSCGPEALKQKFHNKKWCPEERYELVAKVLAGQSIKETAIIPMIIFLCFLKNSIISPLIHPIFYYQKNLCARN